MLDAEIVHLDPATEFLHLGHYIDGPVDILHGPCCSRIAFILVQQRLTFLERGLVVSNDFQKTILVAAEVVPVVSAMVTERPLGLVDAPLERYQASVKRSDIGTKRAIIFTYSVSAL